MTVLVERCGELLDSAEVGLALTSPSGELRVIACTTERMRVLELIEIQNDQGPCRDCFRSGKQVLNRRLSDTADRWPTFTPEALEAGFSVVHALPMRLRSEVIGAMNVFSGEPKLLSERMVNLAQAFADVATIGILQERAIKDSSETAGQLQGALNSRIVIEQAKGVVAEQQSISVEAAFSLLRGYSRSHHIGLSDVARSVINGSLIAGQLTVTKGRSDSSER
ncbi:MAG TPA: GAF and ANTAR domain-containing protein [Acidimicrobiales bacterium]|nr:GAF and ANTAR domain-containing protein [Acidimicrobiales bacterium]